MRSFSISEILDRAWKLTTEKGMALVVVALVIELIQYVISSIFSPAVDQNALIEAFQEQDWSTIMSLYSANPLGTILSSIIEAVLMLGLINCALQMAKDRASSVSFDYWKQDTNVYLNYVVIKIVVSWITLIGLALCILPGLYLSARLQFAELRAIDHPEESFMDHIKESWKMTEGNVLNLIGLSIVEFIIMIIGLAMCCIGVIPASVVCYFAEIVAYLILSGWYERPQEQSEVVA